MTIILSIRLYIPIFKNEVMNIIPSFTVLVIKVMKNDSLLLSKACKLLFIGVFMKYSKKKGARTFM